MIFLTVIICLISNNNNRINGEFSARVKGDFILGALFSVHETPRGSKGTLVCGPIRETYGIQRVETALITLDKINNDDSILNGVQLGLEVRDSCWSSPVALQQSIELVRDAISPMSSKNQIFTNDESTICKIDTNQTETSFKAPMIGVVGPGSSSVTLQVQNLLQLFSIPQIGYSATSRDLSIKSRYSTFFRVVPSDQYQAQLLMDILRYFNWTYVSIVHTEENYGQSGIQAFRELAEKSGVCVAREDSALSTAEDSVFDGVLRNLNQDSNAKIVVCFCEGMTMNGLLKASKRLNMTGRFMYIGSDGWADRDEVVKDVEEEAQGSISIRIHSPYNREFDDHYFSLSPFNNTRNPWFAEFWQHKFNCELLNITTDDKSWTAVTTESPLNKKKKPCTGNEKLYERYRQDPKMSFVIKSFWTMAYGLDNMLKDVCGFKYKGTCREMFPFNGTLFMKHLLNVSFTWDDDDVVEFDSKGDPPGRYDILNYQLLSNGSYAYVQIGDWNDGKLTWIGELQNIVTSVCSRECDPGFRKEYKTGGQEKKCCWACVPCKENAYLVNVSECRPCPEGKRPNENKTDCLKIPEEYISWGDVEAVVAMTSSAVGLMATFVTCHIFIRHNNTPIVKASTRELSYLILAGMSLAHIAVFPILAKPALISCTLSRLMPGISFAMIYASLFTKTNRIARILAGSKKRFPKRKMLFMSATAQIVITCILIMIEVGVVSTMLFIDPPIALLEFPSTHRAVLTCATTYRAVLSPFAFDALLLGLCTLYAVKTRNVPENFNEAKFIGFAMYTTCVIWVAFVPIYFGSQSKVITMCMCVTLSASVTLIFLFLPKLYIIVLRPERNNRALFTTSKSIRCHIGARVAAAIAEPPAKQAIYRLSGSDDLRFQGSSHRSSVQKRTLSIQTSKELLLGICNSFQDCPVIAQNEMCKCNERISKSSENLYETKAEPIDKVHYRTNRNLSLVDNAINRNFERNEQLSRSHLNLSEWAELNAQSLFDRLHKGSTSPLGNCDFNNSQSNCHQELPLIYNSIIKRIENENKMELKARIHEESDHLSSNGDPVINITITLGTGLPSPPNFPQDGQV